jgi:hypothetical protein
VRAAVRACVRACVGACVCACVRVRACVRAGGRAGVRVCVRADVIRLLLSAPPSALPCAAAFACTPARSPSASVCMCSTVSRPLCAAVFWLRRASPHSLFPPLASPPRFAPRSPLVHAHPAPHLVHLLRVHQEARLRHPQAIEYGPATPQYITHKGTSKPRALMWNRR